MECSPFRAAKPSGHVFFLKHQNGSLPSLSLRSHYETDSIDIIYGKGRPVFHSFNPLQEHEACVRHELIKDSTAQCFEGL